MIAIVAFVALGVGAAVWLVGVPRVPRPLPETVRIGQADDLVLRVLFMALGSAPLLMLSVAYTETVPLPTLFLYVVAPAYGLMAVLGLIFRRVGRRALTGFAAGIVAVLLYDLMRLALTYSQGASDPIPKIGPMLMGHDVPWWWGYVWRTLGNGAGLGITYIMICPRRWWSGWTGVLYGSMIGVGMLAYLWSFPKAQPHLFILSWAVVVNGFLGHWTYGAALGWFARMANDRPPRVRQTGRHAKPPPTRAPAVLPGAAPRGSDHRGSRRR